jgi:hypothetical protein
MDMLMLVAAFVLLAVGAFTIGWHERGEHDGTN